MATRPLDDSDKVRKMSHRITTIKKNDNGYVRGRMGEKGD